MKICIVTVYNSINSGSFWQAYILGEYLKKKGIEVYYLKRNKKGTSLSFKRKIRRALGSLKKGGFNSFFKTILTYKDFSKMEKSFNLIDINHLEDIDCFILGSDTIWNFDTKYFLNNIKIYSGYVLPENKQIISYAASFANTSIDKVKSIDNIQNLFKNINVIGVRDNYSGSVIKNVFNRKYEVVCDPTMLFEKKDYENYINLTFEKSNYIILYLFNKMTNEQLKSLLEYAKQHNKKIIEFNTSSHKNISKIRNNPFNLLNYFYYADLVITDTFHGTMFSVNLEKQFYVINRGKNKVNEFLSDVNLDNRLVNDNYTFDDCNNEFIDYKNNKKIHDFREKSKKFIDNYIENINK